MRPSSCTCAVYLLNGSVEGIGILFAVPRCAPICHAVVFAAPSRLPRPFTFTTYRKLLSATTALGYQSVGTNPCNRLFVCWAFGNSTAAIVLFPPLATNNICPSLPSAIPSEALPHGNV